MYKEIHTRNKYIYMNISKNGRDKKCSVKNEILKISLSKIELHCQDIKIAAQHRFKLYEFESVFRRV